ncbi:MAG: glycosyltransferase [Oscillospiraceae bacterium]|nr:glycosyltransferase [Oscillospiraceae bacterium]
MKNLDMVAAIAENGKVYLQNRFGEKNCKNVSIERLGTLDHSVQKEADGPFTIISCSSVIRIKRLERLIDALAAIHDFSVRWIHYGDGPLMERIKSYAREKIGAMPNIEFVFAGYKDNAGLMRLYGEHYYHILVNTSETEGIPVSIMEALSFGIPVIATDVGGCAEIVKDQYCGFIIPKDFRTEELTSKITLIHAMPPRAYRQLRAAARAQWQNYYSAEKNYLSLHEMLLSHFDINN